MFCLKSKKKEPLSLDGSTAFVQTANFVFEWLWEKRMQIGLGISNLRKPTRGPFFHTNKNCFLAGLLLWAHSSNVSAFGWGPLQRKATRNQLGSKVPRALHEGVPLQEKLSFVDAIVVFNPWTVPLSLMSYSQPWRALARTRITGQPTRGKRRRTAWSTAAQTTSVKNINYGRAWNLIELEAFRKLERQLTRLLTRLVQQILLWSACFDALDGKCICSSPNSWRWDRSRRDQWRPWSLSLGGWKIGWRPSHTFSRTRLVGRWRSPKHRRGKSKKYAYLFAEAGWMGWVAWGFCWCIRLKSQM